MECLENHASEGGALMCGPVAPVRPPAPSGLPRDPSKESVGKTQAPWPERVHAQGENLSLIHI